MSSCTDPKDEPSVEEALDARLAPHRPVLEGLESARLLSLQRLPASSAERPPAPLETRSGRWKVLRRSEPLPAEVRQQLVQLLLDSSSYRGEFEAGFEVVSGELHAVELRAEEDVRLLVLLPGRKTLGVIAGDGFPKEFLALRQAAWGRLRQFFSDFFR